ncbi:MAG: hypothetical protein WC965_13860 [Thiohalomonadaceae bacterium]
MDEAINNVIAQFAIENANLRIQVAQLKLQLEKLQKETEADPESEG